LHAGALVRGWRSRRPTTRWAADVLAVGLAIVVVAWSALGIDGAAG
jgi:hypothetical protein